MNDRNRPSKGVKEVPALALRDAVMMPGIVLPFLVGRERSKNAVKAALENDKKLALVAQRDAATEEPGFRDLFEVGTLVVLLRSETLPDGNLQIVVRGMQRYRIQELTQTDPCLRLKVTDFLDTRSPNGVEFEKIRELRSIAKRLLSMGVGEGPPGFLGLIDDVPAPDPLCYVLAAAMPVDYKLKQKTLELPGPTQRVETVIGLLKERVAIEAVVERVRNENKAPITPAQREAFLRKHMDQVKSALVEVTATDPDSGRFAEKVKAAKLPKHVLSEVEQELSRLHKLPPGVPQYGVIETRLNWILSLPWRKRTRERLDLKAAERTLNENHYDLEKVKERILEHLATRKLKARVSGVLMCLIGPPGVGKTSLGQSIADAVNRKLVRISLGGARDEAEIRGHRRTYIGAMPGRVIRALCRAGVKNPLIVLDEIDKISASYMGDPASALLEVLDPEQNKEFVDHYLGIPFDLSNVFFLATGNTDATIPSSLLDRLEIIRLPGYTPEQKRLIAQKYLIPRQIAKTGLQKDELNITAEAVQLLIDSYSREAGVRSLERNIATLCRKTARAIVEHADYSATVGIKEVPDLLGAPPLQRQQRISAGLPGVLTTVGMTYTGADVSTIEVYSVPGKGNLIVTGRPGEMLKETATAALSHFKYLASELGFKHSRFTEHDIHIHFTSPDMPVDSTSFGLPILMAIASRFFDAAVSRDQCYIGEITLHGKLLRVGEMRERFVCACRCGFKSVVVPSRNKPDLAEVPEEVKRKIEVHFARSSRDALQLEFPSFLKKRRAEPVRT